MSAVATLPRRLVTSSRPLSWINTAYPFAAAYLLTVGRIDVTFVVGTIFFLVPYNLAMYGINDVFDYESDLRNPRKGGVEGAVLDPSVHRATLWAAVLVCLPFVVYLYAVSGPVAALVLTVSLFAVVAYSAPRLRFKERAFVDSLTSSTHFVSPAVFGLTVAHATWTPALVAVAVGFFCWGVASQAFGAVQDIGPDREAGLGSVATVIGARPTVWFAAAVYALAGVLLLFATPPGPLAALLALPYIANVLRFRSVTDTTAERTNAGWHTFLWLNYVTGFLVTMLLIWWAMTR
ncbi:prenyltransferase [Tersicoccus sp. MR15.9]|uniref:prenyltransferase n=1 Tax=Tersicoccus mangrovi TaxID=3121635 RepID=UPI002FE5E90C